MTTIEFKHTNKQITLGCISGFFTLLFFGMFIYIIFNLGSFLETHLYETLFLFVLAGIFIFSFFQRALGGKELKKNASLSGNSLIIGGTHRYPLTSLQLDNYRDDTYDCFHLYTDSNDFSLYTNEKDDLIKALLESDIRKGEFELEHYVFQRNSSTVMIQARSGRMMGFNLDNGSYTIFDKGDAEEDKVTLEPEYFVQTPGYKRKG